MRLIEHPLHEVVPEDRVGLALLAQAVSVEAQRAPHRALKALCDRLRAEGLDLDTLSMGMSADLEAAVAEGSTLVRVGTAIFGDRPAKAAPTG